MLTFYEIWNLRAHMHFENPKLQYVSISSRDGLMQDIYINMTTKQIWGIWQLRLAQ